MAVSAIAFTMYPVTDMTRAVAFYGNALGLEQSGESSDYWVEFEAGGSTFGIGNFEQVGTAGTAQSLALEISDLDALRAKLTALGIESTEPHQLTNCRLSIVRDPDGNGVWLHQKKPS